MTRIGTVYVVTCGQCGQIWRRTTITDGQTVECVFCGHRGPVSLGAAPDRVATPGLSRIEAWLPY